MSNSQNYCHILLTLFTFAVIFGNVFINCQVLYCPKNTLSEPLRKISYDFRTNKLFVASTNKIIEMHPTNFSVLTEQLLIKLDGSDCGPDPNCALTDPSQNFNTQVMVIDRAKQNIIVCGTLKSGTCYKLTVDGLVYVENSETDKIVSTDEKRKVYASITPPMESTASELHIGNSLKTMKPGEDSYLKFLSIYDSNTFKAELSLPYSNEFLKNPTQVDVIGSFKHSGYTYFVVNRPTDGNQMKAHLVRICDRNPTLKSVVEVPLECSGSNEGPIFDYAVSSSKTALSAKMGEALKIVDSEILFVLFSGSVSSAICLYPLHTISTVFANTLSVCLQGVQEGGSKKGVFYLNDYPPVPCVKSTLSSIVYKNYCGDDDINFPISGRFPVDNLKDRVTFYPLQMSATSLLVTAANEYNVAFVSTDRNSIVKVKMPTSSMTRSSSLSYDEWFLPVESPVIQMIFDSGEGLYTLHENNVCFLKRAVCNHTTCESCIIDPYCGWCLASKKCSQVTSCPISKLWLSDQCPTLVRLAPQKIAYSEFSSKKIRLDVSDVPRDFTKAECDLSIAADSSPSQAYSKREDVINVDRTSLNSLGFVCKEFSPGPLPWDGKAYINMTIALVLDGVSWIYDVISIYECNRFANCYSCVSTEVKFPCSWCVSTHKCIPEFDGSCQKVPSSEVSSGLVSSPDKCPSIGYFYNESKMFPSGSPTSYYMMAFNVKEHYTSGLSCRYNIPLNPVLSSVSIFPSGSQIFCSSAVLSYAAEKAFQVVVVDLVYNPGNSSFKFIDNPSSMNLTLYKCRYMASSCGKCLTMESVYECVWCKLGFCGTEGECPSNLLERNDTCPNPAVISFKPLGGPLQGGTSLTITGTNLGRQAGDVVVTLGTKECKVVASGYTPTEIIVCNTTAVINPEAAVVKVTVSNLHTCEASTKYVYKNPEPESFSPTRGMKSGGTIVTILGKDLNYGSRYVVTIGDKRATVTHKNATHLVVRTADNSLPKKVQVKVKVDGFDTQRMSSLFEYLNNPDIINVRPKVSLLSGGKQLSVSGRSFDIITSAHVVVTFASQNFTEPCTVRSASTMVCYTPDLRSQEDYFADHSINNNNILAAFGFTLDNVSFAIERDSLVYYNYPTLQKFGEVKVIKDVHQDVCIETDKSDWLGDFSLDIVVSVGGVNCSHNHFDPQTSAICFKPMDCPVKNKDNDLPVRVRINQFTEEVGRIKYPAPFKAGLVIGLILGLLLPIIIGGLIFLFFHMRRRDKAKFKSRPEPPGLQSRPIDDPSLPPRNTNRYEGMSGNNEEMVPLSSDVVDPISYLDDAQFLEVVLNRLDNQHVRNAAKQVYIARERLELGNQLGRGHFGTVYAATLRDIGLKNPMPVAVKTIDDPELDQKIIEGFLKEGIIMKNFNHPHVLSLLGLCLGYKKEPMVILPFMANGDLRTYVKDKKRSFTARQLLQLAQQVAEGMSYLASLNFIHRDLAARNCMIDDKSQVKVADFGLSHELHDREYYSSKNRRAKLPIKWMALESLENYVFTIKSDVWSFGVLLWELMTRGITPYPDVDVFETRNFLASGRRLYKPKFCPDNVYAVMLDCWQESPERRPTFTDLVNRIELLLNPPRHQPSYGEPNYINIQGQEALQDYLKPISSPPEDDQNEQPVVGYNGDVRVVKSGAASGDSHGSSSSVSSDDSSVDVGIVGGGVKEASV